MSRAAATTEDGLVHVVVCGGTPGEWSQMSPADWVTRFVTISEGVAGVGVRWVTLFPHHGAAGESAQVSEVMERAGDLVQKSPSVPDRWVWSWAGRLSVVVDPCADGHARFARVVESLRERAVDFDEETLSRALSAPTPDQADLVLILGPPDVLPTSLVWELSYSELVFLDIAWADLKPVHLEMAIDDFNRRHRRFGGLDS